mmetsp:Transcript_23563/g.33769  ORF Transcript_23563/g.33769 Transcript_23563/m.33769 type:complete len:217 (-) Transcript_23563:1069-1719(-)
MATIPDKAWKDFTDLVQKFFKMPDAEPFREPVDYETLGLNDYPVMIKQPMDLGTIKKKLQSKQYRDIFQASDDVRLVWHNCKTYNADASDFYVLASNLEGKWDERFNKLCQDHNLINSAGTSGASSPTITLEQKRTFAKALYKLSKEELGKVLVDLDSKCPQALIKNNSEDEVELNVDKITPETFKDLMNYCDTCQASKKNQKQKKTSGTKKARTQ